MSLQAQGMRAWLLQRLTAVYIAIYALSLIVWVMAHLPVNYSSWSTLFSNPIILITTIIFYISLFIHARDAMRDILIDNAKLGSERFNILTKLA
jgi:succinate dehydrogenase / fumarate reductase membrane anchor subunit